jgi:hypothetical protein
MLLTIFLSMSTNSRRSTEQTQSHHELFQIKGTRVTAQKQAYFNARLGSLPVAAET